VLIYPERGQRLRSALMDSNEATAQSSFLVKPCHLASGLPTLSLTAPHAGCSNREFTPSCQIRCRLAGKIVGACPFMLVGVVFTMLPVYTARRRWGWLPNRSRFRVRVRR
jgi:hypothetical protein